MFGKKVVQADLGDPAGLPFEPVLSKAGPVTRNYRAQPAVVGVVPTGQIHGSGLVAKCCFHYGHVAKPGCNGMKVTKAPWRWFDRNHTTSRSHQSRCMSTDDSHVRADIYHNIAVLQNVVQQPQDLTFIGSLVRCSTGPVQRVMHQRHAIGKTDHTCLWRPLAQPRQPPVPRGAL